MAREINKDQLWSELARAQAQDPKPDAAAEATSAQAEPTPAIDVPAPTAQANGNTPPPPAPVDGEAVEPITPRETDDAAIARLASMRPMDYERVRKEEAKALGVSVPVLDAEVKAARSKEAIAERMPFTDPEPWGEPVQPAELFDEITGCFDRHVVLEREQADTLTLSAAQSYVLELFSVSSPILFDAAEKACGKSTAQS